MANPNYVIPELSISDMKRIARNRLKGQWSQAFAPALLISVLMLLPVIISLLLSLKSTSAILADPSWMESGDVITMMEALNNTQLTGAGNGINSLVSIFQFLTSGALSLALASLSLKIIRRETYTSGIAFSGFRPFGQPFIIALLISIFTALWAMITVLPGAVIFAVGAALNAGMALIGFIIFVAALIGYMLIIFRYAMAFYSAADNRAMPASFAIKNSTWFMKGRTGKYLLFQLSFIGWAILASLPFGIGFGLTSSGMMMNSVTVIVIGICLVMIGILPLALLQLYIATAQAVYYSTISGNINVAPDASSPTPSPSAETAAELAEPAPSEESGEPVEEPEQDPAPVYEEVPAAGKDTDDSTVSGSFYQD